MQLKRLVNDRRFLVIMLIGPIIICLIFGCVAFKKPTELKVCVFKENEKIESQSAEKLINDIESSNAFSVERVSSKAEGEEKLKNGEARALILISLENKDIKGIEAHIDVKDFLIQNTILIELSNILKNYSNEILFRSLTEIGILPEMASKIVFPFESKLETNEAQEINFFDYFASSIIVLVILGVCVFTASTAISSERSMRTIERIFVSPYQISEIILGKMIAYGCFGFLLAILTVSTLKIIFDIVIGNPLLVIVIAVLVSIASVALGLFVSSITYTEKESTILTTVIFIGLILLMTFLLPLETMHPFIKPISLLIPFTYAISAIRSINLLNCGWAEVWQEIVILAGFAFIYTILAMRILKRELK